MGMIIVRRNGNLDNIGTRSSVEEIRASLRDIRRDENHEHPAFNTFNDLHQGLQIMINDTWAWRVELHGLTVSEITRNYSGFMRLTFFDHFGLDDGDVRTFGNFAHFRNWFILQRFNGNFRYSYEPFVTRFTRSVAVTGRY
jgi:hypothetical protein